MHFSAIYWLSWFASFAAIFFKIDIDFGALWCYLLTLLICQFCSNLKKIDTHFGVFWCYLLNPLICQFCSNFWKSILILVHFSAFLCYLLILFICQFCRNFWKSILIIVHFYEFWCSLIFLLTRLICQFCTQYTLNLWRCWSEKLMKVPKMGHGMTLTGKVTWCISDSNCIFSVCNNQV